MILGGVDRTETECTGNLGPCGWKALGFQEFPDELENLLLTGGEFEHEDLD